MKKIFPIILLLLSASGFTQTKDTTYSTGGDTTIKIITPFTYVVCDTLKKYDTATFFKAYVAPLIVTRNPIFDFTAEQSDALTTLGQKKLSYYNSIGKCSGCTYSITRSKLFAHSGLYSTRYELRNTDADVANSKRVEAARASNDEPTLAERWYKISYYLPDDFVKDPAPELLTQWQSLKGVSPPLAIWTKNGDWKIALFGNDKFNLGAYATKKWTNFLLHVKWSAGSDGLVEIWKDGIKQPSITGPNTYADFTTGNYMKNGIYKWPWKKTDSYSSTTTRRVIYIDDVRIGNSYNDVAQ